jgi:hypothetical protein
LNDIAAGFFKPGKVEAKHHSEFSIRPGPADSSGLQDGSIGQRVADFEVIDGGGGIEHRNRGLDGPAWVPELIDADGLSLLTKEKTWKSGKEGGCIHFV